MGPRFFARSTVKAGERVLGQVGRGGRRAGGVARARATPAGVSSSRSPPHHAGDDRKKPARAAEEGAGDARPGARRSLLPPNASRNKARRVVIVNAAAGWGREPRQKIAHIPFDNVSAERSVDDERRPWREAGPRNRTSSGDRNQLGPAVRKGNFERGARLSGKWEQPI